MAPIYKCLHKEKQKCYYITNHYSDQWARSGYFTGNVYVWREYTHHFAFSIASNKRWVAPEIHIKRGIYDPEVCYRPICLICTQKTSLEQWIPTKAYGLVEQELISCVTLMSFSYWLKQICMQEILNEANRTGKTFDIKMNAKKTIRLC